MIFHTIVNETFYPRKARGGERLTIPAPAECLVQAIRPRPQNAPASPVTALARVPRETSHAHADSRALSSVSLFGELKRISVDGGGGGAKNRTFHAADHSRASFVMKSGYGNSAQ